MQAVNTEQGDVFVTETQDGPAAADTSDRGAAILAFRHIWKESKRCKRTTAPFQPPVSTYCQLINEKRPGVAAVLLMTSGSTCALNHRTGRKTKLLLLWFADAPILSPLLWCEAIRQTSEEVKATEKAQQTGKSSTSLVPIDLLGCSFWYFPACFYFMECTF